MPLQPMPAFESRAEDVLRAVIEGTASVTGDEFFRSLVKNVASALGVRYAFVTECKQKPMVQTLAFWIGDRFGPTPAFDVTDTPCRDVINNGEIRCYTNGLQELFPKDLPLVDLGAVSYLGIPAFDAFGQVVGHIVILDTKPMEENLRTQAILRIFASRAGAELKRQQAEDKLRKALFEVERLKNQLYAENLYLQEEIRTHHHFNEIVGESPAVKEMLKCLETVASTDSTVLIHGPTGTGKELIARALHQYSGRKDRPLITMNCAAISAGLVESELFGHVKGAFTGAISNRDGRFKLADNGTLFLDEVGELALETQAKLLRVLQEQEFEPVGSSKSIEVDVRIIAASNRDLLEEVQKEKFRSDLYYRLNVFPIRVPSLKERPADVPLLVKFFVQKYSARMGKHIRMIPTETMRKLTAYEWPGNVRELQNLIERAVILSNDVLTLATDFQISKPTAPEQLEASATSKLVSLEEAERRHIERILKQTNWRIEGTRGAAKILGVHPNTLRSRLQKLGVKRSD